MMRNATTKSKEVKMTMNTNNKSKEVKMRATATTKSKEVKMTVEQELAILTALTLIELALDEIVEEALNAIESESCFTNLNLN